MKNKIIGLLGVIFILLSVGAWFAYSNTIKNNSELFGEPILVLKEDIKNGEKLTKENVITKKVKQIDIITNALTEKDFNKIENKVAAIDLYKNEQLTIDRLINELDYKPETTRYVAVAIDGIGALSGTIKSGDLVDIWDEKDVKEPELIIKSVEIVAIKDAQNQDAEKVQGAIPTSIVLKIDNDKSTERIKSIKKAFVTKSPNQVKERLDKYKETNSLNIGKLKNKKDPISLNTSTSETNASERTSESKGKCFTITKAPNPGFRDESKGVSVGQ